MHLLMNACWCVFNQDAGVSEYRCLSQNTDKNERDGAIISCCMVRILIQLLGIPFRITPCAIQFKTIYIHMEAIFL